LYLFNVCEGALLAALRDFMKGGVKDTHARVSVAVGEISFVI